MQGELEKQRSIISMLDGISDLLYGFAEVGADLPSGLKELPFAVSIGACVCFFPTNGFCECGWRFSS